MIAKRTGPSLEMPGEAVFSEFTEEVTCSTAGLAALLGLSETLLERADAVGAESNRVQGLTSSAPDPNFLGRIVPIPEPSSFSLTLFGVGTIAAQRRRVAR